MNLSTNLPIKDKLFEIGQAIEKAVRNDCEKNITVSFSGGIDSALVAFLASKYTSVEINRCRSKRLA